MSQSHSRCELSVEFFFYLLDPTDDRQQYPGAPYPPPGTYGAPQMPGYGGKYFFN